MKSSEIVTACKNELPVVLEDGLAWEVVDIAYETYGNEIARYTKKPITLRPLEGQNDGQFKRVGESEIKGLPRCAAPTEYPPWRGSAVP